MNRTDIIIEYAKRRNTSNIEVPVFKNWLQQNGEQPNRIKSIIRMLQYDSSLSTQFTRKISQVPLVYSIIQLEVIPSKPIEPAIVVAPALHITVIPSESRESWDNRNRLDARFSANKQLVGKPCYVICNNCDNSFYASMVPTRYARKSANECPYCSHLQN